MIRGGYKVVDFKDVNLTVDEGSTISGIYEEVEGSYRKAILVSGVTINGVEYRDTFVDVSHAENNYSFSAYGYTFTISNDEKVTIAAAA